MRSLPRLPAARPLPAAIVVALAGLVALGGCGGGEPRDTTATSTQQERFDPRPPLPDGWRRVVNGAGGFSFGLPPGWRTSSRGGVTLVRSSDRALSASLVADRSTEGRARTGLEGYARDTLRALHGYRTLRVGRPTRQRGTRYPTVTLRASGTFIRTGVHQEILLAAVRRPGVVTFSLLFFRSAGAAASRYEPAVGRIIRSLRAQPPQF